MTRRYYHFHAGRYDSKVLLGPDLRARDMALAASQEGFEPLLVATDAGPGTVDGIKIANLTHFDLRRIVPGDAVVLSESIAARIPFLLARRGIPFHIDLYGLPPAELISMYPEWPEKQRRLDRIRRSLRIQFAVQYAERIYLSHPGQLPLLAGIAYTGIQASTPDTLATLHSRIEYLPIGVPRYSIGNTPNPYPSSLQERPIFLFGGGIWSWFDTETLIRAFARISDAGSNAALFFLSGEDRSGLDSHRQAIARCKASVSDCGLDGRSVFFNENAVSPADIQGYLEHCRAGIMADPGGLEARSSWRTRYLDLLAAGKPLVLAGSDPLGDRMAREGCALRTNSGDPSALADSIMFLARDQGLARRMGESSLRLAQELSSDKIMDKFRQLISHETGFRNSRRPSLAWALLYGLMPALSRWG